MANDLGERVAIAVSADLLARSRLEDAAARAGWRLETATADNLSERLASLAADLLVLDLDAGGTALLDRLREARRSGTVPERVLGFFSHVDKELGAAAAAAGCDAMPRGKFWRSLPEVLS